MTEVKKRNDMWTSEEKQIFATLRQKYGNQYSQYREHLPNKTYNQIKGRYHNSMKQLINSFIDNTNQAKKRHAKTPVSKIVKEVINIAFPFTQSDIQQLTQIINYKDEPSGHDKTPAKPRLENDTKDA